MAARGELPPSRPDVAGGEPAAPLTGESLAAEFARTAHAYERRRIDAVLRGFDLAIAGLALLVLSPVLLLVALAIVLTTGTPVIYHGSRVGRFGRIFRMHKFRTLNGDAETRLEPYYGDELTRRTEAEVTAVGRALRASHLDEVPQLWNVLIGDMSIVGPRPIRPSFFIKLCEAVPQYWQRLVVRPGVTGFAQTRVTREEAWEFKLAHDLEYIADRSVRLYLRVLGATVQRIVRRAAHGLRGALRRDA